jgi:hypothetical protein
MKKEILIILLLLLIIVSLIFVFNNKEITNFEECIAAGNPAMESYPRQCMANGKTFVEVIDDYWRLDNIELRQHSETGEYGCFGCSSIGKDPALCIDPILEMKFVEETETIHCNEDFEIVK